MRTPTLPLTRSVQYLQAVPVLTMLLLSTVTRGLTPPLQVFFLAFTLPEVSHASLEIKDLFRQPVSLEGRLVNTTRVHGLETKDLLERSLDPRACSQCSFTNRCCAPPADACCPDGSCIISTEYVCCGTSHICYAEDRCCHDGCIPQGAKCCARGHPCNAHQECCEDRCMEEGRSCCRDGSSCDPGYQCVLYNNSEVRCCPPGGCYEHESYFRWYYYVYWYIEVYWVIQVEVTTSTLELTSSAVETSTSLSFRESNANALSSVYSSLTSSILAAAETTPDLDSLPTRTTTTTTTTQPTTHSSGPPDTDLFPPTTSDLELPPFETIPAGGGGGDAGVIAPHLFFALSALSLIFVLIL
ncbi:hypothetical protein BJX61DRAFT_18291 [Aspergillus egyptiacus]|nr:hypothetical protein BJX61DRAFT_18291 [Aspergillus egyptiacus]